MKSTALLISALAAVCAVPFFGSDYAISFSIQLFMFISLAYSWNLIGGYAGYTHFGQVSFFGVGAYTGALLMLEAGWHWIPSALVAGVCGAALALPLGGAMLRLKGPFFAIGMFGLTRVWESLALEFDGITQGGTGLYLTPLDDQRLLYFAMAAVAFVSLLLTWLIDNSRFGLKLLAIREEETAAEALGIRTTRLKIGAFVVSAVAPAIVGSLYATYLSFIDPMTAFAPMTELTTIAMVLLGGMGTVAGPLVGAVVMSIVNELLWSRFPEVYLALIGLVILFAVLCMPRGIANFTARKGWGWLPTNRSLLRSLAAKSREGLQAHG